MEKIHMIGWALLLVIALASAMSVTVTTEAEAQQKLGSGANLVVGDCEIMKIEKVVTKQADFANDWVVQYSQWYERDGVRVRKVGLVSTKDNTEQAVKAVVAPACEAKWAEIRAQNATVDEVIISPGFAQNNAIGALYDLGKKTWTNALGQP